MTLRAQVRNAIDDIAPPAPDLARRVTAFVLADERDRSTIRTSRRSRFPTRLRLPMALVAAALLVALAGSLVLAGRFWRDLNATPSTISQPELKSLEARLVHFPAVTPGADCPITVPTLSQLGMTTGDGPVYLVNADLLETTDWGQWVALEFVYRSSAPGLVLIRAKDIERDTQAVFAQDPLAPTGITTVGPVLGQVHAVGHELRLHREAVFRDPAHTPPIRNTSHLPQLLIVLGLEKGTSGCIGIQFDGPEGLSENLVLGPTRMHLPSVGTN